MSDTTIAIRTDEDRSWLLEQIEREKIERLQQQKPIDRTLTVENASLWLSRPAHQKSQVITLLQGMIPVDDEMGWLDPADHWVVQRVLADEAAGHLCFPLSRGELIVLLRSYYEELELPLQIALDKLELAKTTSIDGKSSLRKNSSHEAHAEFDRVMRMAVNALSEKGMAIQVDKMPGTKKPFIEYAQKNSKRLKTMTSGNIDKRYLPNSPYRWSQSGGRRDEIDQNIRRILGLLPELE